MGLYAEPRDLFSPLGWSYYLMMGCNVLSPQIFWFRKLRRNLNVTFFMSVIVNIGMWFERFVIIVLPSIETICPVAGALITDRPSGRLGFI